MKQISAVLFLIAISPISVVAQTTKNQGVAQDALDAAAAHLQAKIADKTIAGGAHLVVRHGKRVHFQVAGVCDLEDKTPLKPDTLMRIYSMTKPITSVAAMTLWEQGAFQLDDPVAKFIPSFKHTRVLGKASDSYHLTPPKRPITIRDVFRHTTGYSYGRGAPPRYFHRYQQEGMLYDAKHGMFPPNMNIGQAADSLSRIPLLHHPGARFTYGFNTDLLGRLIEVWSGQPLDEYLRQTLFTPLEMVDTGFSIPREKRHRLASCHTWKDGNHIVADKASDSPFHEGFAFLSGGGGLISTIQDYANFCQMMTNGGQSKGRRLLKESTIKLMFTDQLSKVPGDFRFGLGFAIREVTLGKGDRETKAAAYYWGGYANTAFQIVPDANMFQVFMRQTVPSTHRVANQLFDLVYQGATE